MKAELLEDSERYRRLCVRAAALQTFQRLENFSLENDLSAAGRRLSDRGGAEQGISSSGEPGTDERGGSQEPSAYPVDGPGMYLPGNGGFYEHICAPSGGRRGG